ncbi:putative ribonuclease H-like domain-containing protein [Tanacetum coccineum]
MMLSVNEIEEENNQVNDRFKKVEGYHAVSPLYTGNYMPSRPDLSFVGLDNSIYKTNVSETISSVPRIESTTSKSSKDSLEQPKDVRPSAPIIEECESDSDDDCVIRHSFEQNKPSYAKINFVKSDENTRKSVIEQHTYRQAKNLRKSQSLRADKRNWNRIMTQKLGDGFDFIRPVWNNAQKVNHQNKLTHPHPKRNFVPTTVATKYGLVPVNAAKKSSPRAAASISTARHVNTVALKPKVNAASPTKYSYFKAHSPLRMPFNQKSAANTNNFNKKVYIAKVNNVTTAEPKVVVSIAEGKRENAVKTSACWIWRPTGKVIDHISKDSGSYMPKRFDYVDPQGRLKSEVLKEKNNVLFTETESLVLSPDFKLLDESQVLLKVPRQNNLYSFDLKNVVPSGADNTACYVQNRVLVTKPHNKTPYELLLGTPPSISFMRPFGCLVTILNTLDPLGKFDKKADEGFLVGYSINSKAFRVFNTRTRKVEENLHINFLENKPNVAGRNQTNKNTGIKDNVDVVPTQQYIMLSLLYDSPQISKDAVANDAGKNTNEEPAHEGERNGQKKEGGASNKENDQNVQDFIAELDNLLVQQKEGYANSTNRDSTVSPSISTARQKFTNADDLPTDPLIPDLEDTGIFSGAYDDEDVWTLVDLPKGKRAIRTKWVYRNKKDERGIVFRNKARLVAQGYSQEEYIDYDEVYVCQPPGFEDQQFPDKVYKVEKALYDLHQAPKAWYKTLSTYLLENGYRRGAIDKTLSIKKDKGDILLVQVYVDNIIFGSTKKSLCVEFEQMMHKRFQMSSIGELTFFLGLQVQYKEDGIFISQDKYVTDILKKFDFTTVKAASTLIETNKALNKDEEAEDVDVHLYRSMIGSLMYLTASRPDIMFAVCACARFQVTPKTSHLHAAGASLDRKSTTGGCQFLSKRLISWQCKKQTIVANSTTEAEYVAAANCCGQVLWIQNQMLDYGFNFMNTKIHIDNESTICIVKNLVLHSKTKHIEIRHPFIRDSYEKKLIQVIKIHTDHNVADLLTKAFDVSSDEFGVKTGSCKVNAARQDLVLLGEISTTEPKLVLFVTVGDNTAEGVNSKHNGVFASRSDENAEFHQIVDFLTTSSIHYALTVSPTIYASYIEQFWATSKSKTINDVKQIHATVDGKIVVISESSVRSDLYFNDEDGITCLSNDEIFVNLALMGYERVSTKLTFQKAFFSLNGSTLYIPFYIA